MFFTLNPLPIASCFFYFYKMDFACQSFLLLIIFHQISVFLFSLERGKGGGGGFFLDYLSPLAASYNRHIY